MTPELKQDTVDTIERYLSQKGCTLWMNWDITDKKERREGAEWLYRTMSEVVDFAEREAAT